jgi:hypothetical protein
MKTFSFRESHFPNALHNLSLLLCKGFLVVVPDSGTLLNHYLQQIEQALNQTISSVCSWLESAGFNRGRTICPNKTEGYLSGLLK